MKNFLQFVLCVTVLLLMAPIADAQVVNSGARAITLNATLSDSLSVTLSGNSVSFALAAGSMTNPGSTGISARTTWVSRPGKDISLYAYFTSSTAALSDGAGNNIPSSAFSISTNSGAYTPLSNTAPFGAANAGVRLFTFKITGLNKSGSRSDTMNFNIDLSAGTLPQLPAGTYAGTLNIQAQVI